MLFVITVTTFTMTCSLVPLPKITYVSSVANMVLRPSNSEVAALEARASLNTNDIGFSILLKITVLTSYGYLDVARLIGR